MVNDAKPNDTLNKKIIFPIFSECAQFTLDPFWQQVFEECARGKYPKGVNVDSAGKNVYIRSRVTSETTTYKLKKNPEKVFQELKALFQEQLVFKSNTDRQNIRDELETICKDLQESYNGGWKQIKRKKIKDPIIRRFILDLKKTHELNNKETSQVAQIIKLGFLFNWIENDDVVYEDQQIKDIRTLHFDPEEKCFKIDEPPIFHKREYKPKLQRLSGLWEKYLNNNPKNKYLV